MSNHSSNHLPNPSSPSRGQSRGEFNAATLPEFLRSGWFLSLASGQVLVGWGDLHASAVASIAAAENANENCCLLYAPEFDLATEKPWWITPHWDQLDRDRFTSHVLAFIAHNVNVEDQGFQWVEPSSELFMEQWESIQNGMRERGVKKAVPVVFSHSIGLVDEAKRLKILQRLVQLPVSLHIYGLWGVGPSGDFGILGATPELLFSQPEPMTLATMALAGTRGKTVSQEEAQILLADPKERHEHQLVINDIQAMLSRVGEVTVEVTEVLELPTLFHLKTSIQARLAERLGFSDMVRLLHPTPALGVAPRSLGFDEIRRWSEPQRARFGAPFGVSAQMDGDIWIRECVVAIRNIQWHDREIRLGSGCGVVPESNVEREWQELRLKRESVKRILGV